MFIFFCDAIFYGVSIFAPDIITLETVTCQLLHMLISRSAHAVKPYIVNQAS